MGIDLQVRLDGVCDVLLSDITKGAFQMYMLRWIGSNEDPDFFRVCSICDRRAFRLPKGSNPRDLIQTRRWMPRCSQAAAAETDLG